MIYRVLGIILLAAILTQLVFSFYYSGEIISQNNTWSHNLKELDNLKKQNQYLEQKLVETAALNNLRQQVNNLNLTPVNQELNLNN